MVNPEFALACAGISQTRMDQARNVFGPHTNTSIKIFMNDLAASSFKRSTTPYPVGSIIVKQKTLLSNSPPDNIGVGGMIKRHPGYDPKHGDWEYFYFDQPTNIESGKIDSCVQCHLAAKKDRVFGTWLNKYY
ncbi:MAG TPA: cytochrome P460 family protein [Tepidisphaeraceae bacterium]|jgi:hypothetical protein|nr:cytochrome P460 family protein [Tepidisphaeraceae bacterium]